MTESRALYQAEEQETEEVSREAPARLRDRAHVFRMLSRQVGYAQRERWPHQQDRDDVALAVDMLNDKATALEAEAEAMTRATREAGQHE
jgi:hypothetical protein